LSLPETLDFTGAVDVDELHQLVLRAHGSGVALQKLSGRRGGRRGGAGDGDLHVPSAVARAGKRGLALAQRLFYERGLKMTVTGRGNIPLHTNFVVAANHASHLDMGLVKVALGEAGRDLASLAAADYFFSNKVRRAYFTHFTNLVRMERAGSIRQSMDTAEKVLRGGRSMVVFPEGTRSVTGDMADFLPSLGYLALRARVGLLPAYVSGTHAALPKGAAIPRSRQVGVAFGPFLGVDDLARLVQGLPQQEGWRLVAALVQRIVENLRGGVACRLDLDGARAGWDGQKLGPGVEQRRAGRRPPLLTAVP
jgi:long-chain acyl-CoA synthetase